MLYFPGEAFRISDTLLPATVASLIKEAAPR